MRTPRRRPGPFLLLATLVACREVPATQLVVVVDTNLTDMQGLRDIRVALETPTRELLNERLYELALPGARPAPQGTTALPFSFGVVPQSGDLTRRVRVIAEARTAQATVLVRRSALTGFIEGRVLRLPLFLPSVCLGLDCRTGTTCRGDAPVCVADEVEPARLPDSPSSPGGEFDGGKTLPLRDAAVVSEGSVRDITGMRSYETARTAMYTLIWGDGMSGIRSSFSSLMTPVFPGRQWTTYLLGMTGGDLNGDGFDDFLWPQRDRETAPFSWTILSDAGETGSMFSRREVFGAALSVPAGDGLLPGGASPGDVDGDGFDDVALSKGIAAGGASVPGYLLVRGGSTATVVIQALSPAAPARTGGVFE